MDSYAEELISKYADEIITAEELQALNELLITDPQVATEFCRHLRMDHQLYSHYNAVHAEEIVQNQIQEKVNRSEIYTFKRSPSLPLWHVIREHIWGPVGSLIFHTALITMLFTVATMELSNTISPEVDVVLMEPEETDLELAEYKELDLDISPAMEHAIEVPDVDVALDLDSDWDADRYVPVDLDGISAVDAFQSPISGRGLFSGRSKNARIARLNQYAGGWGASTEKAVVKALHWLRKQQREDGSWSAGAAERAGESSSVLAVTSLSLLTFLAHGETPASDAFGVTVTEAMRYIYKQQRTNGAYCVINKHGVYAHAIATYAISEAYGLTRIPVLKTSMEKAVDVILDGQQKSGGWNYSYDQGPRHDTSVASWQIQALKAAHMAGSTNNQITPALSRAAKSLFEMQKPDGSFAYETGADRLDSGRKSCTAMAVLCLQLTGHARDRATRKGIATLTHETCDWKDAANDPWVLYKHYYLTQMLFHFGGHAWQQWNTRLAKTYTANQQKNGRWTTPYSWTGDDGQTYCEGYYGPAFTTSLATLTLEVYYRFLPSFKAVATESLPEEHSAEDVIIQID